jgi:hypothetical protein
MSPLLIFSNLNMRSPSFRHALRVTIAVAVGFWLGRLLPLTNAYWIVMTTIIILKPGLLADQAAQRATYRRNADRLRGEHRADLFGEGAARAHRDHVRIDGDELQPAAVQLCGERRVLRRTCC